MAMSVMEKSQNMKWNWDSFWLGQYPVTQQIWEVVMGENPSRISKERIDQ